MRGEGERRGELEGMEFQVEEGQRWEKGKR